MSNSAASAFLNRLRSIETTRRRVEDLFTDGQLRLRDVETLYEGLFLRSVVGFENMLEAMFFQVLRGDWSATRPVIGAKVTASSNVVLREVLLDGKDYIDWLPYPRTLERARRYLYGGRPFSILEDDHKNKLTQIVRIRNVIAHASDHSKKQFREKVVGSVRLLPREKSPAGFLRSQFRTAPALTRFEMYGAALAAVAQRLASSS